MNILDSFMVDGTVKWQSSKLLGFFFCQLRLIPEDFNIVAIG